MEPPTDAGSGREDIIAKGACTVRFADAGSGHAEILERRYPVVLHEFSLRPGSGGAGQYRGGDGVVREAGFDFLPQQAKSMARISLCELNGRCDHELQGAIAHLRLLNDGLCSCR